MPEKVSYNAFGTPTAPVTLTALYAGNVYTQLAKYLENMHLDLKYIPAANNSYVQILIELSNDDGVTFFAQTVKSIGTTEIDDFNRDASGASGIPLVFPGDKVSASGSTYKGSHDADIVADYVKISVREVTTGAAGTLYARLALSNKVA